MFSSRKYRLLISGFNLKDTLITMSVLIAGLIITLASVFYNRKNIKEAIKRDFEYSCNEIKTKIEARLEEHSQLLRGGKGLFSVYDTVTREEWHRFFVEIKAEEHLPYIQGYGYSMLIKPEDLKKHEERFKKVYSDCRPDYNVYPAGKRDIYSAIIHIEPNNERNQNALGYDMFSDSVRRRAMEISRDYNISMLTGKVKLVQEDEDMQSGVLMYNPHYEKNMPAETIEERRAAIRGWVYSPYRMNDLIDGIMQKISLYDDNPIRLQIYDDNTISESSLLFDSRQVDFIDIRNPNLDLTLQADFNGKIWTLVFTGDSDQISVFHRSQLVIWMTGLIITILLLALSTMQVRASVRTGEIDQLNKELERMNTDKDRFISILSHDLKSPFTSILGFLDILKTGLHKFTLEEIEDHLGTVNEAAKNTYNLLQDLLMWTKAHTGKIPFNPQQIFFRDKYENVITLLQMAADEKNIRIAYNAPEGLSLYADKDMLKAILRNLISNAIKFTRPGGTVTISAIQKNGGVIISVADTGTGISPEQQRGIFDMSKVLPTEGTNHEKGSGLGLLLCREFVEIHGGKIWFTTEWGKGSDFRFSLPD